MSQISDLFKRIKDLEEQIQQNKDQQDKDYQNALDKVKAVETAHDSLRTNTVHISTKIDKIEKELGVGKDGYQTGGVTIEATNPFETQTVDVRGNRRMRTDKKPVKAKWY